MRAGRRLATSLRAPWIVAYIETPQLQKLPAGARDQVMETLRLAEELGAETVARSGQTISEEILDLVHSRNVTKVVMGQPTRRGWQRWLLGSVVDAIAGEDRDFDLYLVGGMEVSEGGTALTRRRAAPGPRRIGWPGSQETPGRVPVGRWGHARLHGDRLVHARWLRAREPDHGVPGGRGVCVGALRAGAVDRGVGAERACFRFLFRSALPHVRGLRY